MIKYLGFLLAFPVISTDDYEKYIECGISLLENNYNMDSICILAGLTKPYNYFEIRDHILDVKRDLKLPEFSEDESVIAFSFHIAEEITEKIDIRKNLERLFDLYIKYEYISVIYDFYLLSNAITDLDNRGDQYYWDGMSKENAIDIIINYSDNWLKENRGLLNDKI
ncbi:MAG: hypothetical protein GY756_17075 [bacterium]|nr:hypothetical protein [bacterium]